MSETLVYGSMPASTGIAFRIARRIQGVEEGTEDGDALAQGIIPPELLDFLMQLLQDWLQGCMNSTRVSAWKRIRGYVDETRPLNRIGDNARMNGTINAWLTRMGYPRRSGDVVAIRNAVVGVASEMTEQEFAELQNEINFLTI